MVFSVEGCEEWLLSSLHAYIWLVLLRLCVTALLFIYLFIIVFLLFFVFILLFYFFLLFFFVVFFVVFVVNF